MAKSGKNASSKDQLLPPNGALSSPTTTQSGLVNGQRTDAGAADPDSKLPHRPFNELFQKLKLGSIIFPGCKAFEQAIFIGNLLYEGVNCRAVVQAVTVEDVVATVKFAKTKGFKLSIKSGGHSAGGYCLNDGGVVLDISSMNKVEINGLIATVEGGAVWNDVYQCAKRADRGLLVIGGNCPSVGVSAFLMGGGASPYSRKYGLGIDNLMGMTIVTAEGEVVDLSPTEKNQRKVDLFWALRGGGGGNFGVTIAVRIQLKQMEDRGTVVAGNLTWKLDKGQNEYHFQEMMKVWNTTTWPAEVRGDALWHYDEADQLYGKMTLVYMGNWAACMDAILPLLKYQPESDIAEMHWTEWEAIDSKVDVFQRKYQRHTSFIFAKGSITPEVTDKISALMRDDFITTNKDVDLAILWHHIGSVTSTVAPEATAFFWRGGDYVFHVRMLWGEDSQANLIDKINDYFGRLRRTLQPFSLQGKAAYVNFIDPSLQNWGELYYGKNFARLCRVKADWDPNDLFRFSQGIPPRVTAQEKLEVADKDSWVRYALKNPELLGHPRTVDDVFASQALLRRNTLLGVS